MTGQAPATDPTPQGPSKEENRKRIERIWGELSQSRPSVEAYLRGRGIESELPEVLREHPDLPLYDKDMNLLAKYPALVVPFHDADGRGASLHRTYLPGDASFPANQSRKKVLPPYRPLKGGAIRLFDVRGLDHLAVAEGIETALSVWELYGIPCWSLYSANNMEAWVPPAGIKAVSIFGDNDPSCAGQKAAYTLAFRLRAKGYSVEAENVHIPPEVGMDWNDLLRKKKGLTGD